MTTPAGLGRGERALDMVLASGDGTPTRYYAHAGGRPALLVLADEGCVARLDALAEGLTAIGDEDLTVHVVGPPALAGHDLPFPLLQDADGRRRRLPHPGRTDRVPARPEPARPRDAAVHRRRPRRHRRRRAGRRAGLERPAAATDHHPGTTAGGAGRARPRAVRRAHRRVGAAGPQPDRVESSTGRGRAEQHNAQLKRRRDHVVGTRGAAASWPPRSVVGSCPSCRRRSRTGRAASRASRSPATRRPTEGSSAPTATTSVPRPRTVGSR